MQAATQWNYPRSEREPDVPTALTLKTCLVAVKQDYQPTDQQMVEWGNKRACPQ